MVKANGKPSSTGNLGAWTRKSFALGGSDGREAGGSRGGAVAPRKGRSGRQRVTARRGQPPSGGVGLCRWLWHHHHTATK